MKTGLLRSGHRGRDHLGPWFEFIFAGYPYRFYLGKKPYLRWESGWTGRGTTVELRVPGPGRPKSLRSLLDRVLDENQPAIRIHPSGPMALRLLRPWVMKEGDPVAYVGKSVTGLSVDDELRFVRPLDSFQSVCSRLSDGREFILPSESILRVDDE